MGHPPMRAGAQGDIPRGYASGRHACRFESSRYRSGRASPGWLGKSAPPSSRWVAKRMAQRMRMQVRDANGKPGACDDLVQALPRDSPAAHIQKHRTARFPAPSVENPARVVEIHQQRAQRGTGDGGNTLLVALPPNAKIPLVKREVGEVQTACLARAQATPVEHLEQGVVAQGGGRGIISALHKRAHLGDREDIRQAVGSFGHGDQVSGARGDNLFPHKIAVEPLDRRKPTLHRRGSEPTLGKVGFVGSERRTIGIDNGPQPIALQKRRVISEVASVCLDRPRRAPALNAQTGQVFRNRINHDICRSRRRAQKR